jgi:hypothetical protein
MQMSDKQKELLLYTGLLAAVAGDIIPTIGDAYYFYKVKQWRDQWAKGELTAKQFWAKELSGYYLYNSMFWLALFLIVYNVPGFENKLKIAAGVVGVGAVVTVIYKNIHKDIKDNLTEINQEKEKLYQEKNGKTT